MNWSFINKKIHENSNVIIATLISTIVYHKWFYTLTLLSGQDWGYYFQTAAISLAKAPYLLLNDSFNTTNLTISNYPVLLLWGLFSVIFPYELTERILFFWPAIIIGVYGAYRLCYEISGSNKGAFWGSMLFIVNSYVLTLTYAGHITLLVGYSLIPFILYCLIKNLNSNDNKYVYLQSIAMIVLSIYEFRILYIFLWIELIYLIFNTNKLFIKNSLTLNSKYIWKILVPLFVTFAFNLYWLIPMYMENVLLSNQIFDRGLFGNEYMDIIHAFTLNHPFWNGKEIIYFVKNYIHWSSFIFPLLAFVSFVSTKRKQNLIFFMTLVLIGILLVKQVDIPFNELYPWLYENIPGFSAFRESSKFFILIILGYIILISNIFNLVIVRKYKLVEYSISFMILMLLYFSVMYLMTNSNGAVLRSRLINNDYLTLKQYISNDNSDMNVMWLPEKSRWAYFDSNTSNFSFKELFVLSEIETEERTNLELIKYILSTPAFLTNAGVKYIVVPIEDDLNDDNFFQYYDYKRSELIDILDDKVGYLKQVNIQTESLKLYENLNFKGDIYISDSVYYVDNYSHINSFVGNNIDIQNFVINQHDPHSDYLINYSDYIVDELIGIDKDLDIEDSLLINNPNIFNLKVEFLDGILNLYREDYISRQLIYSGNTSNSTYVLLINNNEKYSIEEGSYIIKTVRLGGSSSVGLDIINTDSGEKLFSSNISSVGIELEKYNLELVNDISNNLTKRTNYISNGSFDNGLWEESVSDCNAYDDNGMIEMKLVSDPLVLDNNVLSLRSMRHNACTGKSIQLDKSGVYVLSFRYKVDLGSKWGVNLNIGELTQSDMDVSTNNDWQVYKKIINIPYGIKKMDITVYAYEEDGYHWSEVLYDDFKIYDITDFHNKFYFVKQVEKSPGFYSINSFYKSPVESVMSIPIEYLDTFIITDKIYNNNWNLYIVDEKNNLIRYSKSPFSVNGGYLGWSLSKNEVCMKIECSDSVNVELLLKYSSGWQRYLEVMFLFSLVSVYVIVLALYLNSAKYR
jgi:hypothetical protein